MLQSSVGGEDGVVGLDNGGGGLGRRVDAELELALLSVVDRQTLHQESTETRTSSTTERVEDQEALETNTVVGNATNLVEHTVNKLLSDSVVATGIVVGSILLASDHHLGVEKVSVSTSSDLVNDVGLEIAVDGSGNIFALTCNQEHSLLLEKGRKTSGGRRDKGGGRFSIPVSEKKVLKP